jgi:hypothetical protein
MWQSYLPESTQLQEWKLTWCLSMDLLQLCAVLGEGGFVLSDLYTAMPEFLDSTLLWYWKLAWELQLRRECTTWQLM